MAFGQYILEIKVLVTKSLRNTVDCRCSSETLLTIGAPAKLWSLHRVRLAKPQLKFSNLNCIKRVVLWRFFI